MRSKEEAHDYRYFPCPDLLPLEIEQDWVDEIAATLPELPDAKIRRFSTVIFTPPMDTNDHSIVKLATTLCEDTSIADSFEKQLHSYVEQHTQLSDRSEFILRSYMNAPSEEDARNYVHECLQGSEFTDFADTDDPAGIYQSALGGAPESIAHMIVGQVFAKSKESGETVPEILNRVDLGTLFHLLVTDIISSKIAKDLLEIVYTEGGDPAEIVEARGMKQVTDTGAIDAEVDAVIADNPDQVEKAKANPKLAGWFVGQVMKATGGKANPKAVNDAVKAKLGI